MNRTVAPTLVRLARDLAREDRGLAMIGEGNVSGALPGGRFLVKASGTRMGQAQPADFLAVDRARVLAFLARRGSGRAEDAAVMAGLRGCVVGRAGQPSTETFLHALCLAQPGIAYVGHTHPVAVLGLLCSRAGSRPFTRGGVFPDEIVYCGLDPAVVPYVDPGVKLAFALRDALAGHRRRHGVPPRLVLLENHGIVALGTTADEVLNITLMAEKWAKVLLGTLRAGGPRYLRRAQARHIDRWPAEHYRRRLSLGPRG